MEKKTHKIRDHDGPHIGILILIIGILACLGYLIWLVYGYYKTDMIYTDVVENYTGPVTEEDADDGFPDRSIDIEGLLEANPDFVCWLYYEDGGIDYPVVKEHEEDVNGWMHKAFDGTKNSAGTAFIPYDADDKFHDLNTFLYGHNMANGSLFGSMKFIYRDPETNYKDPYFYIWTKDHEKIKYRVMAMYVVDKKSKMFSVPMTEEGYRDYFGQMMKAGSMESYIKFTDIEEKALESCSPIVTLSTCYGYAGTSKRLLVQGVEIDRKPYTIISDTE